MTKKTEVTIGQCFAEALSPREIWRVEKTLIDGVHAVIVSAGRANHRKTISSWALLNSRFYTPSAAAPHTDETGDATRPRVRFS